MHTVNVEHNFLISIFSSHDFQNYRIEIGLLTCAVCLSLCYTTIVVLVSIAEPFFSISHKFLKITRKSLKFAQKYHFTRNLWDLLNRLWWKIPIICVKILRWNAIKLMIEKFPPLTCMNIKMQKEVSVTVHIPSRCEERRKKRFHFGVARCDCDGWKNTARNVIALTN